MCIYQHNRLILMDLIYDWDGVFTLEQLEREFDKIRDPDFAGVGTHQNIADVLEELVFYGTLERGDGRYRLRLKDPVHA